MQTDQRLTTALEVETIERTHEINDYGFPYSQGRGTSIATPLRLRQVDVCRIFIRFHQGQVSGGSYGLKHEVENFSRCFHPSGSYTYVSNGAFIVAAILEGLSVQRRHDNPNGLIAPAGVPSPADIEKAVAAAKPETQTVLDVDSDHANAIVAWLKRNVATPALSIATLGTCIPLVLRNMPEPFKLSTAISLATDAANAADAQWSIGDMPLHDLPEGVTIIKLDPDNPDRLHDALRTIFGE